ncbi:tail fiber protein [Paenibacillus sp. LHD-38]|uniref:phage tail protein n=1 Tax=Paenibacillus sp. LHD-38 TaxID=3072143 RepID=UPI00280F08A8|nr:tail fiber protein [Paenibacillus sp. LHD-38]MDQ8736049.1 tail fiber protein [Paenibacillus sp. LHD-38]
MEPYVGEIRMFAGNFAPEGWALCNGSIIPIAENEVLFMLLGTTYGGDGQTNFGLPNLASRIPIGQGTNPQNGTTYTLGEQGGTENVTLTVNELPAHTHPVYASDAPGTLNSPNGAVWATQTSKNIYSNAAVEGQMNPQSITPAGGNQPHVNMMPYLPINFIIALAGVFPPQS